MRISKEAKVGTLAFIAAIVLYFGFQYLKGIDFFTSVKKYHVVYKNIDGLSVSNPVIINGMRIGRISDIELLQSQNNKILVTIDVEKDVLVTKDTKAKLVNSDILGGKAIVLEIGDLNNMATDGDTLRSQQVQGIAEVLRAKAVPVVDKLDSTVLKINAIIDNLSGNSEKVNNMMSDWETTSRTVRQLAQENRNEFNTISNNLEKLSSAMASENEGMGPLLAKLNHFVDTLNNLQIQKTLSSTDTTLDELQKTLAGINQGKGTIGKLANNDSLYDNFNQSAASLDSLLIDLREHPKKYVHFSLFGRKNKD